MCNLLILMVLAFTSCNINTNSETSNNLSTEQKHNSENKLITRQALKNSCSILIPESFTLMNNIEKSEKYPGQNAPQEVWGNEQRDINVSISNTGQILPEYELETYVHQIALGIKANIESSKWYGLDIKTINGRNIGVLEFATPALDGEIYNLMGVTLNLKGEVIMYSFNCTSENKKDWKEKGLQIIESLKFI